jgi:transposase
LVEYRRKLVNNRIRHSNRITSLLKMYFPQALDWAGELGTAQSCDFLQTWPTLTAIQRFRPSRLRKFYLKHHCRNLALIEQRLNEIRTARPLTDDPAIVETLSLAVQAEAAQMRPIIEWIPRFDQIIAHYFALHPEHELFDSFPGAGPVYGPRLLTALGTNRSRWDSSADLLSHSGFAPVTEKSGNSCWGPPTPSLFQFHPSNFPRICGSVDPLVDLGSYLLRPNARTWFAPPCCSSCSSFQMDSNHLPMLEGQSAL